MKLLPKLSAPCPDLTLSRGFKGHRFALFLAKLLCPNNGEEIFFFREYGFLRLLWWYCSLSILKIITDLVWMCSWAAHSCWRCRGSPQISIFHSSSRHGTVNCFPYFTTWKDSHCSLSAVESPSLGSTLAVKFHCTTQPTLSAEWSPTAPSWAECGPTEWVVTTHEWPPPAVQLSPGGQFWLTVAHKFGR